MRLRKRLCALLLALLMTLSLGGCSLSFPGFDSLLRSGGVSFDEMEYSRPVTEEISDCASEICYMLDSGAGYRKVVSALDTFYLYYWSFQTMYTLAEIRSDLDTSDEYYEEEYEYCREADAAVSSLFDEVMLACVNSDLKDRLDHEYFNGMLEANYSGLYENGTEKLTELYEQESELLIDYRDALIELNSYEDTDEAYKTCNGKMAQIYIDLVKLRHAKAKEIGYDSYADYAYDGFGRSYTADDLRDYIAAIKDKLIPLYFAVCENELNDESYEALAPFSPENSLELVKNTVSAMDGDLKKAMSYMLDYGLYDVSESESKLGGSYVIYINDYNSPFLFVNPEGYQEDILTVAHEFGHFGDMFANFGGDPDMDTSETMSQGMEYLLLCNLEDRELAKKLTDFKLCDTLSLYATQACFNEFEEAVFSLPEDELTVDRVNSIYAELANAYGFGESYGDVVGLSWVDINHLFEYPFYVISYCVSDSAAFNLYLMELEESGSGLEAYMDLQADAAGTDFLSLLDDKGLPSPISPETVTRIANAIINSLGL